MSTTPVSQWCLRRPAGPLASVISSYVGYHLSGFPPGLHWGVPSRHLTFIVSIGSPIDVAVQVDPRQAPASYRAVVGGLQDGSARIAHDGSQVGVAIELTALGSRRLLGMPAAELWNTSVELADLLPDGAELWERLQSATTWDDRFAVCDEILGRSLLANERVPDPPAELQRMWTLLDATTGSITTAELADEVGWSRQHLARRCAVEVGTTPKQVGRIIRFERAMGLIRSAIDAPATRRRRSIAEIAAVCGYYDQSHLVRDVREFTGTTPSELLAHDLPSVDAVDVPSVQDEAAASAATWWT